MAQHVIVLLGHLSARGENSFTVGEFPICSSYNIIDLMDSEKSLYYTMMYATLRLINMCYIDHWSLI